MADIRTQKYDIGQILEHSWHIFRQRFKDFALLTLVIYLPLNLIEFSFLAYFRDNFRDFLHETMPEMNAIMLPTNEIILLILLFLSSIGLSVLFTPSVAIIIEDHFYGDETNYIDALKKAFSRYWSLWKTFLIATAILSLLYLCFFIPGIVWGIYYIFIFTIVGLRNVDGKVALDYSKSLVKGQWWRVLGITLMLLLCNVVFALFIKALFFLAKDDLAVNVIANTIASIGSTFFTVGMTIFFLNEDYLKYGEFDGRLAIPNENADETLNNIEE